MMNRTCLSALLLLCFCLAGLHAWGSKEKNNNAGQSAAAPGTVTAPSAVTIPSIVTVPNTVVQVSGIVRLVGSAPFSELVITGPDKEWFIERNDERKLMDLQHRTVTVEGIQTVEELTFANGQSAGERRTLKDIRVISVQ